MSECLMEQTESQILSFPYYYYSAPVSAETRINKKEVSPHLEIAAPYFLCLKLLYKNEKNNNFKAGECRLH